MNKLALLAMVMSGGLLGCAKTASEDLLTHGMSAEIEARADGTGSTTLLATLFVGDPSSLDFVELSSDDSLVGSSLGVEHTLDESSLLDIVSYSTTFDNDAEDDGFALDFMRSLDDGAPDSSVTLPAAFDVDDITAPQSRAAQLQVTLSGPNDGADPMSWQAEGTCVETATGAIAQGASDFTIEAGELVVPNGAATSCQVTLTVTRTRDGTLDRGFGHGGSITGTQVRATTFTSNP